ncbi:hypothetical protein [uncultured Microbulbifer sp.]|uniref:hypothetical protein n=1 Tax=uncultured Microbulbifer sp. TaxID=348147 RepID=UPI002602AC96|nr:hypothetical protein [uncultured Microbulbifer sp.]
MRQHKILIFRRYQESGNGAIVILVAWLGCANSVHTLVQLLCAHPQCQGFSRVASV